MQRGMPVLGAILLVAALFALLWFGFLVSTRGLDQAQQDIRSTVQGAAYAAKENSQDARRSAEAIARDVPGVREVQNHLYVTGAK